MSRRKQRRVLRGAKLAAVFGATPIVYLLRALFPNNKTAPLGTPLIAEPGPGALTLIETFSGQWEIDGSALTVETVVSPASWGRLSAESVDSYARTTGLASFHRVNLATNARNWLFGWRSDGLADSAFFFNPFGDLEIRDDADIAIDDTFDAATDYDLVVILRTNGAWFYVRGGVFTAWTLIWISITDTTSPLNAVINSFNQAVGDAIKALSVSQLGAPFTDDFGIATDRLAGARSAGDTFTHTADCFIEFTVTTVPSALQIEMSFRIQDATNRWKVTVDSSGDTDLDEIVAGAPTQRGTAAAVIVDGERMSIRAIGTTIKVYDSSAVRIAFTSASNFQTETDGELDTEGTGGAVDDIVASPTGGQNFDKFFVGA